MSTPILRSIEPFGFDPLGLADAHLSDAARGALARLADVLDRQVRPVLSTAWETATTPPALLDALIMIDLMHP